MQFASNALGMLETTRTAGIKPISTGASIIPKLLILGTAVLSTLPVFAQAGRLDSTFGHDGVFVSSGVSFPNAAAAAIQSNGKIVVSGQFNGLPGVARLNVDGTADPSFGNRGIATTNIDLGQITSAVGIGVQSTGKIVIGLSTLFGANDIGFSIVRFTASGALDRSFGSGGSICIFPFNQAFHAPSVLTILPNDDILLAGSSAIARFTPNGSLDNTFGTDGVAPISFSNITAIALQPNGDTLVGTGSQVLGPTPPQGPLSQGAVVRLLPNGAIDTSFGIDGLVATLPAAAAIAVDSNGRILVAGSLATLASEASDPAVQTGFSVVRLNPRGGIDTTFGTNGGAFAAFPGSSGAVAYAMAIQANGAIVVAGDAAISNTPATDFALARFTSAGVLDAAFGAGGRVTTSLGSSNIAFVTSLAVQSNGGIVVGGVNASAAGVNDAGSDGGSIAVARYTGQ